jgi:glycosyltransferase involved in cell wall biosynthesis
MKIPRLTVIMPAYNAEEFLEESISSILNQTFPDFELLIGDDGSTDRTMEIIQSFSDERIIVIRNEKNLGIPYTLNRLIKASRGEYIARQDSDDISLPKRLEKQVAFLDKNPEIGLCGTQIAWFGSKRKRIRVPLQNEDIKAGMLVFNPICQPTVMFRKSGLTEYYDETLEVAEDYAMCYELSKKTRLANLPDILLKYRWHGTNISRTKENLMDKTVKSIKATIFKESLHYQIDEKETKLLDLVAESYLTGFNDLTFFENFLLKIRSKNKETVYYNEKALQRRIFRLWSSACFKLKGISTIKKIRTYLQSELFSFNDFLHLISWRNLHHLNLIFPAGMDL